MQIMEAINKIQNLSKVSTTITNLDRLLEEKVIYIS